jgi:patatin-like phospholipase/acyl hydrolase
LPDDGALHRHKTRGYIQRLADAQQSKGRYYPDNKDLPLWRVVRASSAAPTFFPPTIFGFDPSGKEGAFVDGGVSMYNNPAMLLYLMATLKGYRYEWETGKTNSWLSR